MGRKRQKKMGDFALGTYKSWQPESDNIASYGPMLQVTDLCSSLFPPLDYFNVTLSKIFVKHVFEDANKRATPLFIFKLRLALKEMLLAYLWTAKGINKSIKTYSL